MTDGELRAVLGSLAGDIRRARHHHPRVDHEPPIPHHVVTPTLSHITNRVRTAAPSRFPVNPQLRAAVDPAGHWEYEQLRTVTAAAVVAAACAVNDAVGLLEALCGWKPAVAPTLSRPTLSRARDAAGRFTHVALRLVEDDGGPRLRSMEEPVFDDDGQI